MEWKLVAKDPPPEDVDLLATDGKWTAVGSFGCGFFGFRIGHYAVCQEYNWQPTHWMPLPAALIQ